MGLKDGPLFEGLRGTGVIIVAPDGTSWAGTVDSSGPSYVRLRAVTYYEPGGAARELGAVVRIPTTSVAWIQERA